MTLRFSAYVCAVVAALAVTPVAAQDPMAPRSADEFRERLASLEASPVAEVARRALNHARRAFAASETLRATDIDGSRRAQEIAWAALDLAAARVELQIERALLVEAQGRAAVARSRAHDAQAALGRARERRSLAAPPETR